MRILKIGLFLFLALSLVNGGIPSPSNLQIQEVRHRIITAIRGGETRNEDVRGDFNREEKTQKRVKTEKNLKTKRKKKHSSIDKIKEVVEEEEEDAKEMEAPIAFINIPFNEVLKRTWTRTPPITLAYMLASMSLTVYAFFFNQNRWPDILHFNWNDVITKGHIWKLITGFLFLGHFDLFYPLTLQFIWQNMSQLEKLFYKTPEEFLFLLLFGCTMLISFYTILGLPMTMLGHNLGSYLLYIWSKLFEGMDVNFMDLFVLKSEILPYFFCLQSLLLEQQFPTGDLLGIVVGYLYYLLKQKNRIWIPEVVRSFFRTSPFLKAQYNKFKDDFEL